MGWKTFLKFFFTTETKCTIYNLEKSLEEKDAGTLVAAVVAAAAAGAAAGGTARRAVAILLPDPLQIKVRPGKTCISVVIVDTKNYFQAGLGKGGGGGRETRGTTLLCHTCIEL
jgi:hypothetical protein